MTARNPSPQPQEQRHTFEVPEGFEAVRDAHGRATGELRPKSLAPRSEAEVERRCAEIADQVEPQFRVTGKLGCTSPSGKRWNAAHAAAYIAMLGEEPK